MECLLFKHHVMVKLCTTMYCSPLPPAQVNGPFQVTTGSRHPRALVKERYALTFPQALRLALGRQWLLYRRSRVQLMFRAVQMTVLGIVIGTLFFQVAPAVQNARVLIGGSFVTLLFLAFGSAPELGLVLQNRG
jgi:hypothetical protein